VPGGVNVAGTHARLVSAGGGGFSVNEKLLPTAFKVAESNGDVTLPTAEDAVAVNVPVLEPEATFTEEGTVTAALPLVSATAVALSALALKVTVQVEVPGGVNVAGTHARLVSAGGGGFSVNGKLLPTAFK